MLRIYPEQQDNKRRQLRFEYFNGGISGILKIVLVALILYTPAVELQLYS